ncbi:MAG: HAD family hydrolase [Halobacteriales archaeon]
MTIRAVGFDLDDTLAVSERDRAAVLREALTAVGGPEVADEISRADYVDAHTRHADSRSREPIFADLLADHDVDPAVATARYRETLGETLAAVGGADGLLADVRAEYDLGLLTDGPPRAQRAKLAAFGWADAFDAVVVTGDLATRKPDPAAFRALLDALGVDPGEAAYVGDHPERDVAGADAVGLRTVQVLGPGDDPVERADAHVRRDALADTLPRVLSDL